MENNSKAELKATGWKLSRTFCVFLFIGGLILTTSCSIVMKLNNEQHLLKKRSLEMNAMMFLKPNSSESIIKTNVTGTSISNLVDNNKAEEIDADECKEKKENVFFLKMHKAGSTTVQNVFLRYGQKNNLTFALPKQNAAHIFNYNVKFNRTMVRPSPDNKYNLLVNHLHFNEKGVKDVMPKNTKFIAIVRHPVDLFESIMSYYSDDVRAFQRVPGTKTHERMKNFLDNPTKYYGYEAAHYEKFAKNAMTWDFGFNNEEEDDNKINEWIEYLDGVFDLVLLTDHFYESMVLLKQELCWNTEDIAFLRSNSRKRTAEHAQVLTSDYEEKLLQWNKSDWKIYQHFNATFHKKVAAYGASKMATEIAALKIENEEVTKRCLSNESYSYFRSVSMTKYKLKNKDDVFCQNFVRTERQVRLTIMDRKAESAISIKENNIEYFWISLMY